jgi:hypothetical protein
LDQFANRYCYTGTTDLNDNHPPSLLIWTGPESGAVVADGATLHFLGHRRSELVGEHEGGLVGEAEIARHGEHALALDLVAEDGDEVVAQGPLAGRE